MHRLTIILLVAFTTASVSAQSIRTFVSTGGNDLNPCSKTLPCRNFEAAIAAVANGGEVIALDSGGYGPVDINKSVSVIAPAGVHAAVAPSGDAIEINVGLIGRVTLRNLYLNGPGTGFGTGISLVSAQMVSIERCVIAGFNRGLDVVAPSSRTFIDQTIFRNNVTGIHSSLAGMASIVVSHCDFQDSFINARNGTRMTITSSALSSVNTAILVASTLNTPDGRAEVTISDCVISGMGLSPGVTVGGNVGPSIAAISHSTISNCTTGVSALLNGTVRLDGCVITRNTTGVNGLAPGSAVMTRQNNLIEGNTTNVVGAMATIPAT